MAKLTPKAKIDRLRSQGFTDRQIADVTGFSASSVGRIRRGQQSGEKISAPLGEFFKLGKRAKANVVEGSVPLPSAKPKIPAPRKTIKEKIVEKIVSPLERAAGQLAVQDSDAQVVIHMTMKGTGKGRTLFANGGVWKGQIKGNLRAAIAKQYGIQYNGDGLDWDDVIDIDIEEY